MIDLHCHMLPGLDDGATDLEIALKMAKMAVADGITITACTPHIFPRRWENTVEGIRTACEQFRAQLTSADIPLQLVYGADIQIAPEMAQNLANKRLPTLHGSRYFLFEPPHQLSYPGLNDMMSEVQSAGFIPIITHPERLAYVESDYGKLVEAAHNGAWIQLTGGSLLGQFGRRARRMSERFLKDGVTHLLASDGHDLDKRAPVMSLARDAAARLVGAEEAKRLVLERPSAVLADRSPETIVAPPGLCN